MRAGVDVAVVVVAVRIVIHAHIEVKVSACKNVESHPRIFRIFPKGTLASALRSEASKT